MGEAQGEYKLQLTVLEQKRGNKKLTQDLEIAKNEIFAIY